MADAIKLGDFPYPQAWHEMQGILAGASFFFFFFFFFFFWARLVDRTGNVGPWYPTGVGVNGQASSDQTEYEEYFSGQIGESAIGQHLGDRINLIDGPADLPGSVNNRIQVVSGEVSAISEKVDGVFAQVNTPMAGSTEDLAGSTESFVGVWSVQSAVIEGDVATGKRVDEIQVQQGQNSAVIQQVSQAQVALGGKASTMWSVKMQIDSAGRYVAAGIGLGIENGPAGLQSQFLVSADRFAVVNGMGGGALAVPFVVQDGQVFINQAFINQAFIKELELGMTLRSAALNSEGLPLLEINIPAGTLTLRGQSAEGATLLNNSGIFVYDLNHTERAALGRLS
ncbi:DUF1983 domain-containing protein [Pseudomonas sp. S1Bt23]|uniref:phage tail protein n=1 Tax=Pseudomonas sp. S1Bt23 TaxID=3095074 RepID=UPI002A5A8674|nr:DUF1983 domain-containing protein [Pseudomonas sp. S1Bt23]WPO50356.1 DUF1983 domain-containing protein [Pseudomonas sp. S1Bt23]